MAKLFTIVSKQSLTMSIRLVKFYVENIAKIKGYRYALMGFSGSLFAFNFLIF